MAEKMQSRRKTLIITGIEETGNVIETCRKYSISNGMYYRWKKGYYCIELRLQLLLKTSITLIYYLSNTTVKK